MFDIEHTPSALRITMSPSFENIDRADEACAKEIDRRQAPVNAFALRILLREAALNAVTHGCGDKPGGQVQMALVFGDADVKLIVEDNGPGFIWENREADFDVTGDGGRGLPLMKVYASKVSYNEAGNRVELSVRHNPVAPAACGNCESGRMV
ncbi:MAG: ATP-binding protein [Planctomycetes bacterium]|nr:ATP-binding protein [Planctomycetota bacterium]